MASKMSAVTGQINRLRELRSRGIVPTQQQIADMMGIDLTTVNAHENGRRKLTRDVAKRYAAIFTSGDVSQIFIRPEGLEEDEKCSECGSVLPPGLKKSVPKQSA